MIEATLALMAGQVLIAAVLTCLTWFALRRTNAGSGTARHTLAATSFFAAALWPLASVLPQRLTITLGPEAQPLFNVEALTLVSSVSSPWRELCAALLIAAAAVALVRLGFTFTSALKGERLAARAQRGCVVPHGLPPSTRIGMTDAVEGPVLAGVLKPTILFPPRLRDAPELTALLRHEHAHLLRGDLRAALMQRVIEDLCWWNWPLRRLGVWLSEQREIACDEYAADAGGDYVGALLREARRRLNPPPLSIGIDGARIERRLERLAEPRRTPLAMGITLLVLTLIAGVVAAPRFDRDSSTYIGIASS